MTQEKVKRFRDWFARNHPFDWWTKERGKPLPSCDRLLVSDLARRAFEAGYQSAIKKVGD